MALLLTVHCATGKTKVSKMTDLRRAFEAPDAVARLGHPDGTIRSVDEYLPGVAWVIIDAPDGVHGGPVVVENGQFDPAHDARTAARLLHRLVRTETRIDASALAVVLERFVALPPGFSSSDISVIDPTTGERGGLAIKPFKLVLVATNWKPPPAGGQGGPGEPPGPPPPPAHVTEAVSLPQPARATLRLEGSRFVWTVETWDRMGHSWHEALRQPIE